MTKCSLGWTVSSIFYWRLTSLNCRWVLLSVCVKKKHIGTSDGRTYWVLRYYITPGTLGRLIIGSFCNLHSRSTWLHTPTPGLSLDSTVFSSVLLLPDFWRARSLQPTLDYWLLYILYTDPMHPSLWTCAYGRTVYGKKMAGMAARPTSDIRPFCGGEGAEEG